MKKYILITLIFLLSISLVNAVPAFSVSPTSINLDGEENTQTISKNFTIKNTGTTSGVINFDESLLDLTDGDYTIDIIFNPNTIGPLSQDQEQPVSVYAIIPDRIDIGKYGGILNITDGTAYTKLTLDILVTPEICEEGIIGDLTITEVGISEEFSPGETIKVDVDVDNDADDDLNVIIELSLYNIKKGKKITSIESEEQKIEANDDKSFEDIELKIPTDSKYILEDGEYLLFIKAYEKGDEDKNCNQKYEEIELKLEDEKAVIESVVFTPNIVSCEDTIIANIKIRNIGGNDLNDVRVEMIHSDLNINKISDFFDLEKFDDKDTNYDTAQITFQIPKDAEEKNYDFLNIKVLYEGESSSVDELLSDNIPKLTVSGCKLEETTTTTTITTTNQGTLALTPAQTSVAVGSSLILNYVVTNPTDTTAVYTLDFMPNGNWANAVSQTITVNPNQAYTGSLSTMTNNVAQSAYSGTLYVKSGSNTLDQKTVNIELLNPNQITGGVSYTKKSLLDDLKIGNIPIAFWIIADLILAFIILALVYIVYRR